MRKNLILLTIAAVYFIGCEKDGMEPSVFESKILGNWLAVDSANQPSNADRGFF